MRSLKDLIVVVTGASQGIGRGIVEQFAAEEAKVVLVARNKERLQKVAQSLGRDLLGRQASRRDFLIVAVDIIRRQNMKKIMAAAVRKFGRIDIFVNNAGVGIHKPLVETTEAEFNTIFDTNLKAIYYSFLELIPLFRSQGGGQIINISSGAGRFGMPGLAVYSASKAALNAFSEAVAGEVRNDNIKISVLAPAST
ncbi:MAG: SDR family oxidoreductase, partial [candidate division Zixibacteria bacterium]|nr:SDR family oxidoreductase [candidate division Zixibacteria bacterium]